MLENQACKTLCWTLGTTMEGFRLLKNMVRFYEGKPEIDTPMVFWDKNHKKKVVELTDKILNEVKETILTPAKDFEKIKRDWINIQQ